MQYIFIGLLLLLVLFGASAKYAYIKEEKTWPEAQQYCQQEYAGLAPISNQQDIVKMMDLVGKNYPITWMGGERSGREREQWMFWGGGKVSLFFPAQDESTGMPEESSGSVPDYFYDVFQKRASFFCYKPIVVREKKSWEEAWSYCRKHHNMLASVASGTELQLMLRELSKFPTTERVWIGLHFFPVDGWLWVDSQPLDYEIWGSGGKPRCPKVNTECAVLKTNIPNISNTALATITASGIPIINNSGGSGVTSGESGGTSGDAGGNSGVSQDTSGEFVGNSVESGATSSTSDESGSTSDGSESTSGFGFNPSGDDVWEANDCEEKLHFICY